MYAKKAFNNAKRFLKRTIQSLEQTAEKFENLKVTRKGYNEKQPEV